MIMTESEQTSISLIHIQEIESTKMRTNSTESQLSYGFFYDIF